MGRVMAPPVDDEEKKTTEDVLREPEERRLELLGGVLQEKAAPDIPHSRAQTDLVTLVNAEYGMRRGGGSGGWRIFTELDISLGRHDWVRPDVCGYRKEKHPSPPSVRPVPIPPDWVCEVISPGHERRDTVQKLNLYHRCGVGHYWLVDPGAKTLTVLRHEPDGYKGALSAAAGESVRAEPFEAVELEVGRLFADGP